MSATPNNPYPFALVNGVPPPQLLVSIPQPLQSGLGIYPKSFATVEFWLRVFLRPDKTHYFAYECARCGLVIGLDWLINGQTELLVHDCHWKCTHLSALLEAGPEGTTIVRWVPAFDVHRICQRCKAPMSQSCRSSG